MSDSILELKNIKKSFGETGVLHGIDLNVRKGEFITLLGSSGCGKTTILRIIAGFIDADEGEVFLDGEDMTGIAPEKRPVNTVFQNYALFPHMTIEENIGYALKLRREKKEKIKNEVARMLSLVQLSGYEKRRPHELSGGQRQRVAIARSVIADPKVLLLDEPLGALDLQLRRQMQVELKRIQEALGITFIYITHDQEEALNLSSRIAVVRNGVFEQIGTPAEIYDSPKTSYVAKFVGEANIVRGKVVSNNGGEVCLDALGGRAFAVKNGYEPDVGSDIAIAVRRENIEIFGLEDKNSENGMIPAVVKEKSFAGGMLRIVLETSDGGEITVGRHGIDAAYGRGDHVMISWKAENAVVVKDVGDI